MSVLVRYRATQTSLHILIFSDVDGVCGVKINNVNYSGTTINAASYHTGIVNVTNLTPDTRYVAEVTIDGNVVPQLYGHQFTPRTRTTKGGIKLAFAPCLQMAGRELTGLYQMVDKNVDVLLTQGDWPYPADGAAWGVTMDTSAWNDPLAFASAHEQTMKIPGAAALSSKIEMLMQLDDHESHLNSPWDGANGVFDNWPSTVEAPPEILPADLSVDPRVTYPWSDAYNASALAFAAYTRHNPARLSNNHFGWYDDFGIDPITGSPLLRVVTPDLISERSFVNYSGPSKRMMSDTQINNLLDNLSAAKSIGIPFILLNFTKKIWNTASDNTDTLAYYTNTRTTILDGITSRGITGVVCASGDRHVWDIGWQNGLACVCACPISVEMNPTQGAGYPTGIQAEAFGPLGTQTHYDNVWGLVEVPASADRIEISVRSIILGGAAIVPPIHCKRNERIVRDFNGHILSS